MRKFSLPYRNKQIFMIPNRYGFLAIVLFIVFSLVAATYSNNLLFLFAFLHVSFILVCILQTARNLRHVDVASVSILSGFPGESANVNVVLLQQSKSTKTGLLLRAEKNEKLINELLPQDQKLLSLEIERPAKRGQHTLGRLRLSTDSPYGLFHGWLYFKTKTTYFVYPLPRGLPLPKTQQLYGREEFSGLKTYQLGDSLQRISWKHSSKSNQLLVKEYKDATTPSYFLKWEDCTQNTDEERLQQLARWIVDCEAEQIPYKLQIPGAELPDRFDLGFTHFHQSLLSLAQWEKPT